jgi:catechol 2,3-dioxygenase-like lactoylglutathione lyase family enzyme
MEEAMVMNAQKNDNFQLPEVLQDGGLIVVPRENHETTIAWFEKYAGWKRTGQEFKETHSIVTEMWCGVWVYCNDHYILPDGIDSNVRWCFKTPDLQQFHTILSENGEKVTEIYHGLYGHDYFDFWVTDGVRLTAEGAPDIEDKQLSHDWVRIGVSELQKAKEWYIRYIGMSVLSEHPEEGYVVMGMRFTFQESDERHPFVVLEQLAEGSSVARKDERKRPYYFVKNSDFWDYHRLLAKQGIPISEVEGNTESLAIFHIFDPDGNRFNIRTFPM